MSQECCGINVLTSHQIHNPEGPTTTRTHLLGWYC